MSKFSASSSHFCLVAAALAAAVGFGCSSTVLANQPTADSDLPIAISEPIGPSNSQTDKKSDFVPLSLLHDSMWTRLSTGFEFSDIDNERVDGQVKFLRSGLRSLRSNLIDAGPYLFHIVEQLEQADLPVDIALLPLIESAFNPTALSSQHAMGIWQFIPATANHYGLSTGKHYDQRRDVMASTTAAIQYLRDLNTMFDGDWLLALAAYNTGPGNVRSAMRKALRRGQPPTYWNLKLSTETNNYVPRLIAATKMISNPEKYGLRLPELANRKQIESVAIGRRISLSQIAELTGAPIKQITELNQGLHKGLTPPDGPHTLTLPVEITQPLLRELKKRKRQPLLNKKSRPNSVTPEVKDAFVVDGQVSNAARTKLYMPSKRYEYKTHVVQHGDSLWDISRKLNVNIDNLRQWNDLEKDHHSIRAGDTLRIATLGVESIDAKEAKLMNYRVMPKDTLVTIANKFDLRIGEIKKWNESLWHKGHVQAGQVIRIPTNIP